MKGVVDWIDAYCRRYERSVAAVIAFSSGYATPECAANILRDAHARRENWSEWIYECYRADPLPAVQAAIRSRHRLTGYMGDYQRALAVVRARNMRGTGPLFASWF